MSTNTYTKLRLGFSLLFLLMLNVTLFGQYPPSHVPTCNDYDPCTIDIVDHCGNCFHIRKNCDELEACDDGNPCTIDIIDITGTCRHFPKVCDDGNPATRDYCDPWGNCRHELIDCDDGDPDTHDYIDSHGHCQHIREVCCDDNNPCTHDYIDPYTGECVHEFLCDDGDPCTIDVCNPNTGECWNTPKSCKDADPCTIDYCDPYTGECVNEPRNCDDGDPCTIDYCDPYTGYCVHEPKNCDDGDPCTIDSCDPYTGHCRHRPDPHCDPCYGAHCDDYDPCTIDTCDPYTGHCIHTPDPSCDPCYGVHCDDYDPCTIDSCDPYTGQCVHLPDPHCNPCYGVDCDDNNPCTYDYCNPNTGLCVHIAIDCNDGDPCTIDYCNPYTGDCVHELDPWCNDPCYGANCDDGNPCTVDYCNPNTGECVHVAIYCSDNDPCTIDSCDPYTGNCIHTPDPACHTEICAFTQGFWGNPGGYFNGQSTSQILHDILENNPLIVGVIGHRSLKITQANKACIFDLLPGGGPSGPLPNNTGNVFVTTPNCNPAPIPTSQNGSLNNTLLSQTITLALNIKFDPDLGNLHLSHSCVSIGYAIMNMLPNNPTVNDLLALANNALAGLTVTDYSMLSWALSEISETFDNCHYPCFNSPLSEEDSEGYEAEEHIQPHTPTDDSTSPAEDRQHDFKLFPNPSSQTIMVDLRDYVGKQVNIQIFNTLGQPVHDLKLPAIPNALIPFNVSGFTDGLYFMKVKIHESDELTREFVVNHK